MQEGVVILGHGSRLPEANQEIFELTEQVKARGVRLFMKPAFYNSHNLTYPRSLKK
ncbi:sirohydrochlorin chelatase [Desulforamulus profundi]|uniref:sirohydrochlorin chelatase n=1 Tax=Desulforamulus profundi TaxID=1383067 RepID=UPI001EE55470|nr:CbiX/SirB N-terminal domain-containing protein [Desulforamulus profundi]